MKRVEKFRVSEALIQKVGSAVQLHHGSLEVIGL